MPCCDKPHCFDDAIFPNAPRGERRCLDHASGSQRKRFAAYIQADALARREEEDPRRGRRQARSTLPAGTKEVNVGGKVRTVAKRGKITLAKPPQRVFIPELEPPAAKPTRKRSDNRP